MTDIETVIAKIIAFRDARDWKQFHNPKDVSISLCLEAAEVLEHFQWKSKDEVNKYIQNNKAKIGEELADVLMYTLLLSHELQIDIMKAISDKMHKNATNYPLKKAKGKHTKYTDL